MFIDVLLSGCLDSTTDERATESFGGKVDCHSINDVLLSAGLDPTTDEFATERAFRRLSSSHDIIISGAMSCRRYTRKLQVPPAMIPER